MKMKVNHSIPDALERIRALNPERSFIVQAPAGSGKTTLLIQRYLKLLTCVDAPEEIIAITFTRKAAAEMRMRVLETLETYQEETKNSHSHSATEHDRLNYELSTAALLRDRQLGWQLIENPQRLRIQTIDSLCASLVRQMPVLSQLGAPPKITERADELYLEAARMTLKQIEGKAVIAQDIKKLFEYLDNDWTRVESLLAEMLAKRDQWLRHTVGNTTREELQAALHNTRNHALQTVYQLFPSELQNELVHLMRYAASNLSQGEEKYKQSAIIASFDLENFLTAQIQHWQGIAALLLTIKDNWRSKITVNEGFPAGSNSQEKKLAKEWKDRWHHLIQVLQPLDDLRQALQAIRQLPPPQYSDQQWQIIGAITRLLHQAVAALKVVFQHHGEVDFAEITARASQALGDPEEPTDLALALDYRIQHLLIDEFQDTSISQFRLIEKLIAGWETGDGRTLFAVGDPMQSIYRFREAEVGLFLQASQQGIGDIPLEPVTLTANFRSQQGVVDWVNATFSNIMPNEGNISKGAVAYSPSIAIHEKHPAQAVKIHPFFARSDCDEAIQVLNIILETKKNNPNDSIAILVRNRNHLDAITTDLKRGKIPFRAVEIEALDDKPVVQDLLVLTRALLNPADRIAWIALLRTPFGGILLNDLVALVSNGQADANSHSDIKALTIWELLCDESFWRGPVHRVSVDGMARMRTLRGVLQPCIEHRQRQSLRSTVETAWRMLGGPGCVDPYSDNNNQSKADLSDADIFLDYLEKKESARSIPDVALFEKGLRELYALSDPNADDSLQIMTIHKAKGLEFDTVIVPGLGRVPRNKDKRLLKWLEQPTDDKNHSREVTADLLLAPIARTGEPEDSIYRWIDKLNQEKEQFESVRLLYVAATRAKKQLHLLGHTELDRKEGNVSIKEPAARSLLSQLWKTIAPIYSDAFAKTPDQSVPPLEFNMNERIDQNFYRLPSDWILPDAYSAVNWKQPPWNEVSKNLIEFSWASEIVRCVGVVTHRWLQQIAEDEMQEWSVARIESMQNHFKKNLLSIGMNESDDKLNEAVDRIIQALTNAVTDKIGRWILSPQFNAQNELKITGMMKGHLVKGVIDRTFCDLEGNRWIIDYKISSHEGKIDMQEFLDREKLRYQKQLEQYKCLMQQIDSRPIKLGLYFPMMRGWRIV